MRSALQQRVDADPGGALESLLRHRMATFLAGLQTIGTGNMEDYHFPTYPTATLSMTQRLRYTDTHSGKDYGQPRSRC